MSEEDGQKGFPFWVGLGRVEHHLRGDLDSFGLDVFEDTEDGIVVYGLSDFVGHVGGDLSDTGALGQHGDLNRVRGKFSELPGCGF